MTTDAPPHPTCEARLPQLRVVDYGFERITCHQWRGLRTFFDENGTLHRACVAPGHMADVVRRFGAMPPLTAEESAVYASLRDESAYFRAHEDMPEGEARADWGNR